VATAGFAWGCSGGPSEPSGASTDRASTEPVSSDPLPPDPALPDSAPTDSLGPASTAGSSTTESPGSSPSADHANYHVPVPAELEPYSNFELSDLRLRAHGGEWELEYTLPELLVGGRQRLSFRGSASETGDYQLLGDAGLVTCHSLGASMTCDEVLNRVELDRDKLERSFAALPAPESAARWAVADHFSDDPIGVLTFPAQPR
jgi:hypothetical protein